MSCDNVVDIEDMIGELFEFDDNPDRVVKQRKVKKNQKKKAAPE